VDVTFPDGTVVRASAITERVDDDPSRDFGLYLDSRWAPTWPAEVIDWPDFGLPADPERAASQIEQAFARARDGETVEIGCLGGLGRTGTVLACFAVVAGVGLFVSSGRCGTPGWLGVAGGSRRASGAALHPATSEKTVKDAMAVSLRFRLMVNPSSVAAATVQRWCQRSDQIISCG